jgi:glutamate transport system permease protein
MCLLLTWLANYLQKREKRSKKHIDLQGTQPEQIVLAADAGGGAGAVVRV